MIGAACADAGTGAHRFIITVSPALLAQFAGQVIYVHGISPVGRSNLILDNAGVLHLPAH